MPNIFTRAHVRAKTGSEAHNISTIHSDTGRCWHSGKAPIRLCHSEWVLGLGNSPSVAHVVPALLVNYNFAYGCFPSCTHCPTLRLGESCVDMLYCRQPHSSQAKKRQWRVEELVIPRLRETRPLVEKQVVHEMRVERAGGAKEELRRAFGERVKKIVRLCPHSRFEIFHSSSYYYSFTRPDARTTQRTFRRTPLSSLANNAHPAAHAASAVRGLIHVSLQTIAITNRVRLGVIPHAHFALAC